MAHKHGILRLPSSSVRLNNRCSMYYLILIYSSYGSAAVLPADDLADDCCIDTYLPQESQ